MAGKEVGREDGEMKGGGGTGRKCAYRVANLFLNSEILMITAPETPWTFHVIFPPPQPNLHCIHELTIPVTFPPDEF